LLIAARLADAPLAILYVAPRLRRGSNL